MRCPFCKDDNDRVIDSRSSSDGYSVRRRRECLECHKRYTTYERVEEVPLRVVKKDGSRAPFERTRILSGLIKACEKRPVSINTIEDIVDKIEREISEVFDREVTSKFIGDLVMRELKILDQVAYVRFASVYHEFKDVTEFLEELRPMLSEPGIRNGLR